MSAPIPDGARQGEEQAEGEVRHAPRPDTALTRPP